MTENYDFKENRNPSWFNHLMLSSKVSSITEGDSFDSSKLEVELKINGKQVLITDFNEVLGEWSGRIERQIKENLDYMSREKSVVENAEIMLKDKLGDAWQLLQQIEDSAWKLSCDED